MAACLGAAADQLPVGDTPTTARTTDRQFISWREHLIDDPTQSGVPFSGSDGLVMGDLDGDERLTSSSSHCRTRDSPQPRSIIAARSGRLSAPTRAKINARYACASTVSSPTLACLLPDRRVVLPAALRALLREHLVETLHGLPLPGAHLVRVHLVPRRDHPHRALPERLERHPFLKSAVKRRLFLIMPVSLLDTGVHLSDLSKKVGHLTGTRA